MKITVIGTGYVGLVAGTGLAEIGHTVTCVDKDSERIDTLLNGNMPIYEPGLENLVIQNCKEGVLNFSTNLEKASENSSIFFIAVGTPPGEDGSADLQYVIKVAEQIGRIINQIDQPIRVIFKVIEFFRNPVFI